MYIVIKKATIAIVIAASMLLCACGGNMDAEAKKNNSEASVNADIENEKTSSTDKDEALTPEPHDIEKKVETPYKELFVKQSLNYDYSGRDMVFTAKTIEGEEFNSGDYYKKGKITVLTIWSTYCSACIQTMPVWGKLAEDYEGSGVQFLGICEDVSEGDETLIATAKEIISGTGADYTQLVNGNEIMQKVISNIMYLPTTFFIDSDGKTICAEYIGYADEKDWINIIETIMEEKA